MDANDSSLAIVRPAIVSSVIAIIVEVPMCIFLSLWGMKEFAYYISKSAEVAEITRTMWRVSIMSSKVV
jgi:hypothetical protein